MFLSECLAEREGSGYAHSRYTELGGGVKKDLDPCRGAEKVQLTTEVHKKGTFATARSVWLKAVTEEPVSVKSKLATSRMKSANLRWSAHSVFKGASNVEMDVCNAHKAVSGKVTHATKRKAAII